METENLVSIIESVLFVSSEPITVKDLAKIVSTEENQYTAKDMKIVLQKLSDRYSEKISGLVLSMLEDKVQIVAKPVNNEYVEKITVKKVKKTLTQASLEVISIIAYRQPITKPEIEEIRGVKSDAVIGNLVELGIIEEKGRLERIGRPILYGTTDVFLKEFGLDSLINLPKIENLEKTDE